MNPTNPQSAPDLAQPLLATPDKPEVTIEDAIAATELQKDPNEIVPIRPRHLSDAEDGELKVTTLSLARKILANPTDVSVTVEVYSIGTEFMRANTEQVGLMETRMADVMKEITTGNPVAKSLTEIKTKLDMVNPAVVSKTATTFTEKRFFGWLTRTVSRLPKGEEILLLINERKDTVASTINGLRQHLFDGRDTALKNAAQLGVLSNKLFETQNGLQAAAYQGELLWKELKTGLERETDPLRQQALRNLVNDLAVAVVDLRTIDALNVQSRMGAETLINNARQLSMAVARVCNVLLPAVAVNLLVKAAAQQQLQVVAAVQGITAAAQETIQDTARDTRQAVVRMAEIQSSGFINPEALQKAIDEYIGLQADVERIQNATEMKARAASQKLGELADTMRKHADPMTRARHALEGLKS